MSDQTIPPHLLESLQRYIDHGVRPGAFLQAVLANDLFAAARNADDANRQLLGDLVFWLWYNAPLRCTGSWEAVERWIAKSGNPN